MTAVVVIGAGVAGTAAAWGALRAGARVTVASCGAGASCLMSGAVDRHPWHPDREPPEREPVDDSEASFLDAIKLWDVGARSVRLASLAGVLRPASGADRALLDLAPMNDVRIAVPRIARPSWDADLLARGWTADAWARARRLVFEAVDCPSLFGDLQEWASDEELAARLDDEAALQHCAQNLASCVEGFGAVLLGPWLGIATSAGASLRRILGKPVGETLSQLAGSAGARFEAAAKGLLTEAQRVSAYVIRIERSGAQWDVRYEGGSITTDAVIIACGGLVGGGLLFTPSESRAAHEIPDRLSEPFAMSFESEAAVAIDGRVLDAAGSLQGPNLEELGWPRVSELRSALESVGVHRRGEVVLDRSGAVLEGLFVAGSAASGAEHTVLGSIRSGLNAGTKAGTVER